MRIGFTCSTFDLFHAGHVSMLREVKQKCDHLIVGIQTDPTIDRPEKNKPVQSVIERQIQVSACRYVDEIIVYTTISFTFAFIMASIEEEIKQERKFETEYEKAAVNIMFTSGWLYNINATRMKKHGITPEQYNVLRILRGSYPKPLMLEIGRAHV